MSDQNTGGQGGTCLACGLGLTPEHPSNGQCPCPCHDASLD
jgi:hypothetical protein